MKRTDIEESKTDKLQPFRVWYNGNIIWFAKTREEAEWKLRLEIQKELENRVNNANRLLHHRP